MLRMEEMPSICRHLFQGFCLLLAHAFVALCVVPLHGSAEAVPATHRQGSVHGFLLLKSENGKVIAIGDETNIVRGDEIHSRLVFHFRDGSMDEEITTFRQGAVFQLIRDRHIQKGASFPQPLDFSVNVPRDEVTWWEMKDGKSEVKSEHVSLPFDLVNGMMPLTVENFPTKSPELKVSYVVVTSKPRIVKLSIKPDGEDKILIGGIGRRAKRFNVHVEIGGISGAIAPVIGKQPSDTKLWIMDGEVPALVKTEGGSYSPAFVRTLPNQQTTRHRPWPLAVETTYFQAQR